VWGMQIRLLSCQNGIFQKKAGDDMNTVPELVDKRIHQNLDTRKNLEETYQEVLKALCGEAKSQKSDGMSPKQLGEGFKETVERYKGMGSEKQTKYPITEYTKKIGLTNFDCGDAERGVFKNFKK